MRPARTAAALVILLAFAPDRGGEAAETVSVEPEVWNYGVRPQRHLITATVRFRPAEGLRVRIGLVQINCSCLAAKSAAAGLSHSEWLNCGGCWPLGWEPRCPLLARRLARVPAHGHMLVPDSLHQRSLGSRRRPSLPRKSRPKGPVRSRIASSHTPRFRPSLASCRLRATCRSTSLWGRKNNIRKQKHLRRTT